MAIARKKLIAVGFALVGLLSLLVALLPVLKGGSPNGAFVGIGAFWLIMSIAVSRRPGAAPPN